MEEKMEIKPDELKAGDIIACTHTYARQEKKEVLRVILTKAGKKYLEGVILLSDKETWGQENVGGTFRMATENCVGSMWRIV
mgnify:CR=1 FL=1